MHRAKSEYAIQTVSNALRLLEAFDGKEELGVTELAKGLSLHKNHLFRLLATLEEKGYVEQNENERYRLGSRCLQLAHSFSRTRALTRLARPALERLACETGETAHLGVLHGFEVVHLDGEQSQDLVVTALRTGKGLPSHCTALGKVLLACAPPGTLEAYDCEVASKGLRACTEQTIVDRDKLIEHLRHVASRGWAVDFEETAVGLSCAAAPVTGGTGWVLAALSISGPAFRLDRDELEGRIVPAVVHAANGLSRQLGSARQLDRRKSLESK